MKIFVTSLLLLFGLNLTLARSIWNRSFDDYGFTDFLLLNDYEENIQNRYESNIDNIDEFVNSITGFKDDHTLETTTKSNNEENIQNRYESNVEMFDEFANSLPGFKKHAELDIDKVMQQIERIVKQLYGDTIDENNKSVEMLKNEDETVFKELDELINLYIKLI